MKVTDLEDFSLQHIWRPYQGMPGSGLDWSDKPLPKVPMSLEETAARLRIPSPWSDAVIGRLAGCRVTFPSYVQHPLVDAVRDGIAALQHEAPKP